MRRNPQCGVRVCVCVCVFVPVSYKNGTLPLAKSHSTNKQALKHALKQAQAHFVYTAQIRTKTTEHAQL